MLNVVNLSGRVLGASSGAAVAVLWMLAIWMPSTADMLAGISLVVSLLMVLIALFAVIASVHGHSLVLIFAFVASFLPIGFNLIASDEWMLAWIGRLNVAYLIAGALMRIGRRGEART